MAHIGCIGTFIEFRTQVLVAPDSGFFLGDQSKPAWPASLAWIATAMNSTRGLDASCVSAAAAAHKSAATECTLPEDVAKHIEVWVLLPPCVSFFCSTVKDLCVLRCD